MVATPHPTSHANHDAANDAKIPTHYLRRQGELTSLKHPGWSQNSIKRFHHNSVKVFSLTRYAQWDTARLCKTHTSPRLTSSRGRCDMKRAWIVTSSRSHATDGGSQPISPRPSVSKQHEARAGTPPNLQRSIVRANGKVCPPHVKDEKTSHLFSGTKSTPLETNFISWHANKPTGSWAGGGNDQNDFKQSYKDTCEAESNALTRVVFWRIKSVAVHSEQWPWE